MKTGSHPALTVLLCLCAYQTATAGTLDFSFQATTLYSGPGDPGFGFGVNAFDFDRDGDVDIFIPTASGQANQLLVNQGDGSFVESAAQVGLADTLSARSALWLDFEGDGDFDLLIGRDCYERSCSPTTSILSLYQNNAGTFTEVTQAVGLFEAVTNLSTIDNQLGGLSAADASGDGLPDIYAAIWQNTARLFFSGDFSAVRGDDPGGYLNAGNVTGINNITAGHWQGLFHDFDNDDVLDLFVNVDFEHNQLWLNAGMASWNEISATAAVDSAWNEMGLAPGDFDSDGDIDLYITNIHAWIDPERGNRLYRNDTVGNAVSFTDVAPALSVEDTDWGWGATWLDADNDGDLDLAVTNGYCQPAYCGESHRTDQSRFYINNDHGSSFSDESVAAGFDDTEIGSSLVTADFNRDGRMDLVQSIITATGGYEVRLLTSNAGTIGNYLRLELTGTNVAGTTVALEDADHTRTHLVTHGNSFLGQEPLQVHFGQGDGAPLFQTLTVTWPDGQTTVWGASIFSGSATNPMLINREHLFSDGAESVTGRSN